MWPSAGGPSSALAHNVSNSFQSTWVKRRDGYGFDRWILDKNGRLVDAIGDGSNLVLAWSPDGQYLLSQSYGGPIRLLLATSHPPPYQVYGSTTSPGFVPFGDRPTLLFKAAWLRDGRSFVFITPSISMPGFESAHAFFYHITQATGAGNLLPIQLPGNGQADDLAICSDQHSALLLGGSGVLYHYNISSHSVQVIAQGVRSFALQPTAPATATQPLLYITATPQSVASGGTLTLRVQTEPDARVRITLRVLATQATAAAGPDQGVRHVIERYRAEVDGVADQAGLFVGTLPITYRPAQPVQPLLTVTVTTNQGTFTGTTAVTIQPPG